MNTVSIKLIASTLTTSLIFASCGKKSEDESNDPVEQVAETKKKPDVTPNPEKPKPAEVKPAPKPEEEIDERLFGSWILYEKSVSNNSILDIFRREIGKLRVVMTIAINKFMVKTESFASGVLHCSAVDSTTNVKVTKDKVFVGKDLYAKTAIDGKDCMVSFDSGEFSYKVESDDVLQYERNGEVLKIQRFKK